MVWGGRVETVLVAVVANGRERACIAASKSILTASEGKKLEAD